MNEMPRGLDRRRPLSLLPFAEAPKRQPRDEDLLAFVEACRSVRSFDALLTRFLDFVRPMGFDYVGLIDLSLSPSDPLQCILFSTFLPEWIALYGRTNPNLSDPLWLTMLTERSPFVWSEAERENERRVTDPFFRSIGLVDGMTVPLSLPKDRRAAMFLGATRPLDIDFVTRATITFACNLLAIRSFEHRSSRPLERKLTGREREILTLTALGRSAREISVLLDLSEKTVVRHLLNIRMKLQASNTVQAVARAVQEKIITI